MNRFISVVFIILVWSGISMAQSGLLETLKADLVEHFNKVEGDFAVAFKDMQTGETLFINEKEEFHAASTMKTPVMLELYKQSEEGRFDMNDSVTVVNDFKSIVDSSEYQMDIADDGGDKLYGFIGQKRSIYDLTYDMITVSSNLATNILIQLVDAKKVMETMKEIGANDIKVLRGVEDLKAYRLGMNNTTTAYDMMMVFDAIANCTVTTEGSCKAMINILLDQYYRDLIPAKLPEEVKVAHKTGSISGVQHDSGIVYLPDGRQYILVILGKNIADDPAGTEAEAEASKMIYEYMVN